MKLDHDNTLKNVHIFVNGYYQGTLHVNRYFHKSSMEIYINREGIFNFEIFAECLYLDRYGQPKYDRARSSIGDVYANVGSRFILMVTQYGIDLETVVKSLAISYLNNSVVRCFLQIVRNARYSDRAGKASSVNIAIARHTTG